MENSITFKPKYKVGDTVYAVLWKSEVEEDFCYYKDNELRVYPKKIVALQYFQSAETSSIIVRRAVPLNEPIFPIVPPCLVVKNSIEHSSIFQISTKYYILLSEYQQDTFHCISCMFRENINAHQ